MSLSNRKFNFQPLIKCIIGLFQIKPAVNQIECHPYLSQDPLVAFCKAYDIHVTAYSPLGCKDRLWKSDQEDDVPLLEHPILNQVAKKHGKTVPQVILKWQVMRNTLTHVHKNLLICSKICNLVSQPALRIQRRLVRTAMEHSVSIKAETFDFKVHSNFTSKFR